MHIKYDRNHAKRRSCTNCGLRKKCFNDAWNLEQIENELEVNPFSNGYMLKENDKVVAYAFMWETFEMAQIARIGVDPDQRKNTMDKNDGRII